MARTPDTYVNPDEPASVAQFAKGVAREVDGRIEFGSPQDPLDPASTAMAEGTAATHNGTVQNMLGSWVELDVTSLNTRWDFPHNLDVPITAGAVPNVRMLNFMFEHDGTAAAPLLDNTPEGTGGRWHLIREHEVTGSAETDFTFTDLDGDTDKVWQILSRIVPGSTTAFDIDMQPNADATTSNYRAQLLASLGAITASASRTTQAGLLIGRTVNTATTEAVFGQTKFWCDSDDQYRVSLFHGNFTALSAALVPHITIVNSLWTNQSDNVTSLKFVSSAGTLEFGVGTRIQLYALRRMSLGDDATVSFGYDTNDSGNITKDSMPLRFYAGGNRLVGASNPLRVSLFFTPAVR